MSTILGELVVDPPLVPDDDDKAHLVPDAEATEGYVLGTKVTAACGYEFVPTRDPEGAPLCEACLAALSGESE